MKHIVFAMLMAICFAAAAQERSAPGNFNFDPETQTVDALFTGTPDSITFNHAVTCNVDRVGCTVSQRMGDCVVTLPMKFSPGQTAYIVCPGYSEVVTVANFSDRNTQDVLPIAIILGNEVWLLVQRPTGALTYISQANLSARP